MPISTILGVAQIGMSLWDSYKQKSEMEKRQKRRSNFFDSELKPLLDEATNIEAPDFNAIRQAEMSDYTNQMQNQMESLIDQRSGTYARSGFGSSGFIDRSFDKQSDMLTSSYEKQQYQTERMIQDMQSQFDDTLNANKLRAKELEYSYKYG